MPTDGGPLAITPDTKVGDLLESYPHLEDVLMDVSPSFKALKNPVLRRTMARIATLRQVSRVGDVPLGDLIDRLRVAAGQQPVSAGAGEAAGAGERPAWADPAAVVCTFDARPTIAEGGHPMPQVMRGLSELKPGEVYTLVTPFVPAPLVQVAAERGFASWSVREAPETVCTFFTRREG